MKPTIDKRDIPQPKQEQASSRSPVDEVLMFRGPAFAESFHRLLGRLNAENIEYVTVGELALAAYRCPRLPSEIHLCVRDEDLARFWERLVNTVYECVQGRKQRFRDPQTGVVFTLLVSGDPAGRRGRNSEVRFPDPDQATEVEGLRTVSLERLIALKLATWRFRDWADVIELMRTHGLDRGFARKLPESVRPLYFNCYEQMLDEDRYDRERNGGP